MSSRASFGLKSVHRTRGYSGAQVADLARGRRAGLELLFIAKDADIMASGKGRLVSGMEVFTMALEISALANKVRTSADAGPAPARLAV